MSGLDLYQTQRTLALMFVYASLAGFLLGGVYDVLRILRLLCGDTEQGKRSKPLTCLLFLEDAVFMLVAAVTLILLCYYTNDGQLRAPAVIGMACGFFVYLQTVGRLVHRLAQGLVKLIRSTIALCVGLLLTPLRGLWSLTVGRMLTARRERMTEKYIHMLTETASRGFDLMTEEPPVDQSPDNHEPLA